MQVCKLCHSPAPHSCLLSPVSHGSGRTGLQGFSNSVKSAKRYLSFPLAMRTLSATLWFANFIPGRERLLLLPLGFPSPGGHLPFPSSSHTDDPQKLCRDSGGVGLCPRSLGETSVDRINSGFLKEVLELCRFRSGFFCG